MTNTQWPTLSEEFYKNLHTALDIGICELGFEEQI